MWNIRSSIAWTAGWGYRYRNNDYDFHDAGAASHLSGNADFHAASTGLGYSFNEHVRLNYGFEYRWIGDGDMTHAVSLDLLF